MKGIGDSPDDTVLNFGGPGTGKGIFVQTDNVRIENLWVKNTGDNGIEQDGTTGSEFVKVHVSWDNADPGMNGAYGVYPTNCEDTLVEYIQATDARDAGIYIGKCGWEDDTTPGGVARYNVVGRNVLGLEAENSLDVQMHDNLVIDNSGGLFPAQQPIEESPDKASNTNIEIYDNKVWCNNHENFATSGIVRFIPAGSGMISLAGDGIEIRDNDIQGNDTLGIAVISNTLTCQIAEQDCPPFGFEYNPYAQNIYIHDNNFVNNGTNVDPSSDFSLLFEIFGIGTEEMPTEDVIWDGYITPPGEEDPGICLGEEVTVSYRDFTRNQCQDIDVAANPIDFGLCLGTNTTTDPTGRDCVPE